MFVVIIEPQISIFKIYHVAHALGLKNFFDNSSNKIWLFWNNALNVSILNDFKKIMKVRINVHDFLVFRSFVYATCNKVVRREIWNQLLSFSSNLVEL